MFFGHSMGETEQPIALVAVVVVDCVEWFLAGAQRAVILGFGLRWFFGRSGVVLDGDA